MAMKRSGVEQTRTNLPDLLERSQCESNILALRGTGKGLWGASVKRAVRQLRVEWD